MLKREKYIYENEEFKIINPDKGLREEITKEMSKYVSEDGEINIENDNFKLYLLQTLVDTENKEYQFVGMTQKDIDDIEENPSFEYETILFFIGNILSDIIIETYRKNILELRQTQIELLQNESLKVMEELAKDVSMLTKKEEKVRQERNVTQIRNERNLDEIKHNLDGIISDIEDNIPEVEKEVEEKNN